MSKTRNTLLIIVLAVIVALFLYFYSGAMNLNDWLGRNSLGWAPALFTFGLGILVGWLFFRKKVQSSSRLLRMNFVVFLI